jgi:putative phosphoribosyl transferase
MNIREYEVLIPAGVARLEGTLALPLDAKGLVLFAHGSGSSRHSRRNRQVAAALQEAGMATLLFDLLTAAEAQNRGNVFNIELLADRLRTAARWTRGRPDVGRLPLGYFGASTGAAAALVAAAGDPDVGAVVSRGGRPDLAGESLPLVLAPTLLIVGGADEPVIGLNEEAYARLACHKRLVIVPGATHLFEEPGTLEQVATLADGERFTLTLSRQQGYQFAADFGAEGVPPLVLDEPPPLGTGTGPNPTRVLAAAIGNCLSASLLYCLEKARVPVSDFGATVEGELVRNPQGRLRIGGIRVTLAPVIGADPARIERCRALFEDFCIVTQSVRDGIDVEVDVVPAVAATAG